MADADFSKPRGTLLLSAGEVRAALPLADCIDAVEQGFVLHESGRTFGMGVLDIHAEGGGFHVKAAGLKTDRAYFAAKTNANFPDNGRRFGLPTIQGAVILCDGENGYPLAILDSMSITALRTAAATAVAVRWLARGDAQIVAIAGCGRQAADQLAAVAQVRKLSRVFAHDLDRELADAFAAAQSRALGIAVEAVTDFRGSASEADICITCTTSRAPLLGPDDVRPGALVAAVGADNPEKSEIAPGLMARCKVVADSIEQCAAFGDLHHALKAGAMEREQVHGELGAIVTGKLAGRTDPSQIFVFDSTGTAVQDVAVAVLAYRNAQSRRLGMRFDFAREGE